jgi:hypothetical protein
MGLLTFLRDLFGRKDHLKDMLLAVDDEISWIRKKGSGKRVRLYDGEKRSSTAELFYYVFKLDEELRGLGDDTPIELIIGTTKVNGAVVAISPNEITIAVEKDLGEKIQSATLVSQAVFILVGLRKHLSGMSGNHRLANQVLDGKIGRQNTNAHGILPSVERNHFQDEAVERIGKQSVSYVWGPPGTGKT